MLRSQQTEKVPDSASSTLDTAAVREQLKRLLAHPLFTHSKRYPVLLAYIVEQTLTGHGKDLKERTIGVEAFGREPSYDVNIDPVVRTTAAEVRKRLIQYYYSPDHAQELVIELPLGSYIPSFREPASHPAAAQDQLLPQDPASPFIPPAASRQPSSRWTARFGLSIAIVLLALLIGFGAGRVRLPRSPSQMERFWEPFTSTSGRVTYCLGEPSDGVARASKSQDGQVYASLNLSDVITLARSVVPLVPRSGAFRVLAASDTGFTQLREGPFVLIGAFDNPWTMRLTQDLPFGFEYDKNGVRQIVDRKSAQKRFWTLQWQIPNTRLARDYALVARIHDNVTGQPVMVLAGIMGEGTEAAGELVSNPEYLGALLKKAPKNWDQLNLEAVIETQVIEGHSGPPTVIAVQTW